MDTRDPQRSIVDRDKLPDFFPTQRHSGEFWEALGRVIGTFGFLEDTLARAIFAFTATREYSEEEIEDALNNWLPKLERALSDQLWNLTETYSKSVRDHKGPKIDNFDELVDDLKKATVIRNVLCHGSWPPPDMNGASIPKFVNRQGEFFETPVDVAFLNQVQASVTDLICSVVDTVTFAGWQFPGSNGPGEQIWRRPS